MFNGIVNKGEDLYYYENGQGAGKGLIKYNGDYYYAENGGKLVLSQTIKATATNCDLPVGKNYEFGADGKMLNGIVTKGGELYYYENGQGVEKGLLKYNGDYYYAAYKGKILVSQTVNAPITSCDLPAKVRYEFGADGKMLNGIVEKDGVLYYYENGQGIEKCLFELDGHYYYAAYKGKLLVNITERITLTNNILIADRYTFNEYGQIVA